MLPSSYLVDSSILIPYIRQNQVVIARLNAVSNTYISPTIIAELAYGAFRSRDPQDGMQRVQNIMNQMPSVDITPAMGLAFAAMKNRLITRNQLIPENDMWIAVAAITYGMTLIARDAHFGRLTSYGLQFQAW